MADPLADPEMLDISRTWTRSDPPPPPLWVKPAVRRIRLRLSTIQLALLKATYANR